MFSSLPRDRFPVPPSGPSLPYRDVVLIDLARHALMRTSLTMGGELEGELREALKAEADRLGARPDSDPEPALDALEPFALAWARARAAAPMEA